MIIGFAGLKKSGKDTAAEGLYTYPHPPGHITSGMSFAAPLKHALSKTFDLDREFFEDPELKDKPFAEPKRFTYIAPIFLDFFPRIPTAQKLDVTAQAHRDDKLLRTPREIMQYVGTDLVRNLVHDKFWVDELLSQIWGDLTIITDVRFYAERRAIRERGGYLIKIVRDSVTADAHPSENSLGDDDEYDLILYNNGTIKELHDQLIQWYNSKKAMERLGL